MFGGFTYKDMFSKSKSKSKPKSKPKSKTKSKTFRTKSKK